MAVWKNIYPCIFAVDVFAIVLSPANRILCASAPWIETEAATAAATSATKFAENCIV